MLVYRLGVGGLLLSEKWDGGGGGWGGGVGGWEKGPRGAEMPRGLRVAAGLGRARWRAGGLRSDVLIKRNKGHKFKVEGGH